MNTALVHKSYLLQKFPGKGGWTYAAIPEIAQDKNSRFGWVRVKGFIDDFEIKNYHLMPMGNGQLFFPIKAEIRKKINKKEGDWVSITLYADTDPIAIPEELALCLKEDAVAYDTFLSYPDGEKKAFIDWIYAAKTDQTKVDRIVKTLNKLVKGERFYDK